MAHYWPLLAPSEAPNFLHLLTVTDLTDCLPRHCRMTDISPVARVISTQFPPFTPPLFFLSYHHRKLVHLLKAPRIQLRAVLTASHYSD
jgi:hypothetical protein